MANKTSIYNNYFEKQNDLNYEKLHIWLDYTVFSWRWWLGVLIMVCLTVIWLKFRKKESTDRLLYTGLFVAILASFLDMIGVFLGLWEYRYEVFPLTHNYFPWDLFLLPISIMIILQIKPNMNPFIKGIIYAGFSSFIGLPLLTWLDIYKPIKWEYIYSFPILVIIYLAAHYVSLRNQFEKV